MGDAVNEVNSGKKKASDFDGELPTISTIVGTTAILEAGRKSLDLGGVPFDLEYTSVDVHAVKFCHACVFRIPGFGGAQCHFQIRAFSLPLGHSTWSCGPQLVVAGEEG